MEGASAAVPESLPEDIARAARDFQRLCESPWLPTDKRPTEQQAMFLLSPCREALYGGAAAGGKSIALLMAAAMYVDVPGYAALLLRRSFRHLNQPEALIPVSKEWWTRQLPMGWNAQDHRWTFPSGATITFGYLEHEDDVLQYDGAAFQFVGYDELQQFSEYQYTYLFSRMRKRTSGEIADVPIRMRASAMPGGPGHEWVKKRFLEGTDPDRIFVRAKLDDNPHVNRADYIQSLSELDPITRAQRLEGDWDAYSGGRFLREWFKDKAWVLKDGRFYLSGREASGYQKGACTIFVTVDLAASEKTSADYTVFGAFALTPHNDLLVLEIKRERFAVQKIVPELHLFCSKHKPLWVGMEADGFQVAIVTQAQRTPGMPSVRGLRTDGKGKLVRATPAINRAASGQIFLPADGPPWVPDYVAELVRFTGDPTKDRHDDMVDVTAWAALEAQRALFIPPCSMPNPPGGTPRPENRPGYGDPDLAGKRWLFGRRR